jgi:hypothetical protein
MAALTPSPTLAVSCSHKSSLHYSEVKSESSFIFILTLTDIEVLKLIITCRKRDTKDTMKHYSNDEENTRDVMQG